MRHLLLAALSVFLSSKSELRSRKEHPRQTHLKRSEKHILKSHFVSNKIISLETETQGKYVMQKTRVLFYLCRDKSVQIHQILGLNRDQAKPPS